MKKGKKGQKLKRAMTGVLILLLIILGIVVVTKDRTSEESPEEPNQVTEEVTDDTTDETMEEDEEDSEESEEKAEKKEDEPQQMLDTDTAQELVKDKDGEYTKDEAVTSGEISVDALASFSGQYVEDGRDELVEGVASILVTNNSDEFLELAILAYEIGGKVGTFVVSSLPAGESAWVMEKNALKINGDEEFEHLGSTTSFKADAISSTKKLKITSDGNMLTVENKSDKTMKNVAVYYKVRHTDGNYFGGITYTVGYGDLKAGESIEKLAGHYDKETSDIVRISWQ